MPDPLNEKAPEAGTSGAKKARTVRKATTRKIVPQLRSTSKSAPPTPIEPDFDAIARHIDTPLKKLVGARVERYVMWKFEWRNNKWTKPPYQTNGKYKADTTDPATWCTLDDAIDAYETGRFDGMGIVLGELSDSMWLAGVDLDGTAACEQWHDKLPATYVEISVGGIGTHALCIEDEPRPGKKRDGVEIYNGERYFTLTGQPLPTEKLRRLTAGRFDPLRIAMGFPLTMDEEAAGDEFKDELRGPLDAGDLTADERAMLAKLRKVKRAAEIYDDGVLLKGGVENEDLSERDHALVSEIAAACNTQDPHVINRLARASVCYRAKWDTLRGQQSWLGYTISHTLARKRSELKAEFAHTRKATSSSDDDGHDNPAPLLKPFAQALREYEPPSFLIQNVLPNRGLITVTGHPGSGKTTVMLLLAQCCLIKGSAVAHNLKLRVTHPIDKAAILCGDDYDGTVQRLQAYIRANIFEDATDKLLLMGRTQPLDEIVDQLATELDACGAELLVVDTGIAYAPSNVESENDAFGMQSFYNLLRELARNRLVVVCAHPPYNAKDNAAELRPRGSSAVLGTVDGNIAVWQQHGVVHMQSSPKWRGRGFSLQFALHLVDSGYKDPQTGEAILTPVCKPITEFDRVVVDTGRSFMVPLLRVYADAVTPPGRASIEAALGCSRDTVDNTRTRAVDEKLLRKLPGRTGGFEITEKGRATIANAALSQ